MRAYYALVDDILAWDEFEEVVYALNPDSDDEESEKYAAAEVVRRHGRLHPKISNLSPKPTLNSFFCKVIEKEPLKEFIRSDKSPGLLTRIIVGDETGEVVLVFWDERAYAAEEINAGDILEVAVRFKNLSNVNVVDLRKADAEICLRDGGIKTLKPCYVKALILEKSDTIEYRKKDDTPAFKVTLFVYEENGFARITVWNQNTIKDISAGMTVKISGAVPRPSSFKEYFTGDDSSFEISDEEISPPLIHISEAKPGEFCSIAGVLDNICPVSGYFRDDETILWLKKGILSDDTGKIPFVLWGGHAKVPYFKGDTVSFYNCQVKTSVSGSTPCGFEIHAGYNSCILSSDGSAEDEGEGVNFSAEGILADFPDGTFLVNEDIKYLLKGGNFRPGEEITVSGILNGHTICVQSSSPVLYDLKSLNKRLESLRRFFSDLKTG